jgi:antibiotic biosynthesis monooxygenase (ABM) superfamily enzyme
MVLYVVTYDIHPDKTETYLQWAQQAIPRMLAIGGVTELRGYRGAAGAAQIVATFEFADMAGWAGWHSADDAQAALTELRTLATNVSTALWGPSPLTPQPVRPGG